MEKKYPMTYQEFEKRVIELFLSKAKSPSEERERKSFVRKESGVIEGEYDYACYCYDDPKRSNIQFTDEGLINQPVRILDMLY